MRLCSPTLLLAECTALEKKWYKQRSARGCGGVSRTVMLEAVPVILSADLTRADLASVRQDYNEYHEGEGLNCKAERAGPVAMIFWTRCLRFIC